MQLFQLPVPAWRDLVFFGIALGVHIALLLLPIKAWQTHQSASERPNKNLTLSLSVHRQPVSKTSSDSVAPPPKTQALVEDQAVPRLDQKKPAAEYSLAEIPPPPQISSLEDQQASDTSPNLPLNTQQLRQWVEQADGLAPPQQGNRTLGTASSTLPPANWNRHAGAAFFASFDDRSHEPNLPADVTVVDRWQAADGSHQVVVQLPTGESLCGRAEAHNPMQPLVEHIMMFGVCGKTPTFTMPERFNKGR